MATSPRGRTTLCLACLASLFGAHGCTNADLERIPEISSAALQGQWCTLEPDQLSLPVKILLIIDTSGSMVTSDPLVMRASKVRELVRTFNAKENFSFGIIDYSDAARVLTEGFTKDETVLGLAIEKLMASVGGTRYTEAIAAARKFLMDDFAKLTSKVRRQTKYVVIFLSDGQPNDKPEEIYPKVEELMSLEEIYNLGHLELNTAYLNAPGTNSAAAVTVMQEMAAIGKGSFRQFDKGEDIDFIDYDYSSVVVPFELRRLLVSNLNTRLVKNSLEPDSDGDGLADAAELAAGTDPLQTDTDSDGCNDLLERQLGFDPLRADCCQGSRTTDTDQDGLTDCEERHLFTDKELVDTDGDDLPDLQELQAGTNPTVADSLGDIDQDETRNDVEVLEHTDPAAGEASELRDQYAYVYDIEKASASKVPGQTCYRIAVSNIQVTASSLEVGRSNRVVVYAIQALRVGLEEETKDRPIVHRAEVELRYQRDATHRIEIGDLSFVELRPSRSSE